MTRLLQSLKFGAGIAAVLLAAPGLTYAQGSYGGRNVLSGQRYDTMRSLAHYLDEGAQFTSEEAQELIGSSRRAQDRALVSALRRFADRTGTFHDRMDEYKARPADLDREVQTLQGEARRVNSRLRRVSAASELYDDWTDVLEDLGRMRQLMAGIDVQVPPAHAEWEGAGDHHHGSGMAGYPPVLRTDDPYGRRDDVYRTGPLSRTSVSQFRSLAHDLDLQASRVHDLAESRLPTYADHGQEYLTELHHFATAARALHDRSDQGQLVASEIGPDVDHLLADARSVDRSMRSARVFSEVWDEWQQTISILERMNALVRR